MFPTLEMRLKVREKPQDQAIVMYQKWRELLFLHWKVSPQLIQSTLPKGLFVDTYQEEAYLGVVPFLMRDIRPRFLPTVPGVSNFLELNVRTYVFDAEGRPGVWFYSLDASQSLAVQIAKTFFKLPYFKATMGSQANGESRLYTSKRLKASESSRFEFTPQGSLMGFSFESLEFFLLERYLLFAYDPDSKRLWRGQVNHLPYPLQNVEVTSIRSPFCNHPLFADLSGLPIHQIYSPGVDVAVYPLIR